MLVAGDVVAQTACHPTISVRSMCLCVCACVLFSTQPIHTKIGKENLDEKKNSHSEKNIHDANQIEIIMMTLV